MPVGDLGQSGAVGLRNRLSQGPDAVKAGFPLLSDPSRTVAAEFGVKRPLALMNKRSTFVIDTDRRILAAISSELNMDLHADEALRVLHARES